MREAQHRGGHVLLADGVADGLLRILPAEEVSLIDLDHRAGSRGAVAAAHR